MLTVFGYFGHIIYIGLLLTNAIAILSEERFLAKSGFLAYCAELADTTFLFTYPYSCDGHIQPLHLASCSRLRVVILPTCSVLLHRNHSSLD
jgi:hypothetical protein